MQVLTDEQLKGYYFDGIGGFPALGSITRAGYDNFAQQVKDYKGQERLCICCTQLEFFYDSEFNRIPCTEKEKKLALKEWLEFLTTNTKAFKALHFNSHVPQRLFDAACRQENLEELRTKWGNHKDLSALENLTELKYLYFGSCPGVTDLTPLTKLKNLVVLHLGNFKRIEDYSPLIALEKLEQLVISGPILGTTPIKDFEFLREMPNLLSFRSVQLALRKKYTDDELLVDLVKATPNLRYAPWLDYLRELHNSKSDII